MPSRCNSVVILARALIIAGICATTCRAQEPPAQLQALPVDTTNIEGLAARRHPCGAAQSRRVVPDLGERCGRGISGSDEFYTQGIRLGYDYSLGGAPGLAPQPGELALLACGFLQFRERRAANHVVDRSVFGQAYVHARRSLRHRTHSRRSSLRRLAVPG